MLKILAIVVVVVLVVIAGILIYASTRPDSFRVQRSVSIKAPPQKIFPLIDDLKAWAGWSPYEKKDPAMKRSFGPVTAGKGATYEWEGNKKRLCKSRLVVRASEEEISVASRNGVRKQGQERCIHYVE